MSLADLLNQANQERPSDSTDIGPTLAVRADARKQLGDLAPDMARLLIDMAAWLDEILTKPYRVEERWNDGNDLLARFADLNAKAGGQT